MNSRIYRSTGINDNNTFGKICKLIEIIENTDTCKVLIYYLGSDLPFYSLLQLPINIPTYKNWSIFVIVQKMLNKLNISVENWHKVNHSFLYECNSMISKSIRPKIENLFLLKRKTNDVPSSKNLLSLFKRFNCFENKIIFVHLLFKEFESEDTSLKSFILRGKCTLLRNINRKIVGFLLINGKDSILLFVEITENINCIIIDPIHQIIIGDGTILSFSVTDCDNNIINY